MWLAGSILRVVRETESNMVVAKGLGQGEMGSWYLMGTEFQFYKMKRIMEMNGGDSCMTL